MGTIQILPPNLVNRIAAGECVERPASVVKELVENALDAGASQIDILVEEGGRDRIQVVDDGHGMDIADLKLAVHPHATSKIREDDDLFNIHTMGFRGEALPSIGSVSRLSVTTRTRESDVAYRLTVDAGRTGDPQPTAGPPGTRIEVRDLFYCVPARRKFLRTNQTEMGHITEQIARLTLAHGGVGFTLKHGKRIVHQLPPTADRRSRIRDLYGPELADVLLPIERAGNGLRIEGLVAPPSETRGSGKWEYVFVNGRYVRDRFVSHAVKEAYRSLIDPSRYPVVFLFISVDPGLVDVNVHPTKSEVRWRDSNYVHGQVLAALREKFLSTNLDRTMRAVRRDDPDFGGHQERVRQAMVDFFTQRHQPQQQWLSGATKPASTHDRRSAETAEHGPRAAAPQDAERTSEAADRPAAQMPDQLAQRNPPLELAAAARQPAEPDAADAIGQSDAPALQIHRSYLVVETEVGLEIIDQHALHERILYEQLRARMTAKPLESQRLLLPEVYTVPADRLETLETHAELLDRLGIELTASGPQSVTLHTFPSLLERADRQSFVRDLLDRLAEAGATPKTDTLIHALLDMMACKAAVKAGDPLTAEEIRSLLSLRTLAERSSNCPHGRPTVLRMTVRDLERQFERR